MTNTKLKRSGLNEKMYAGIIGNKSKEYLAEIENALEAELKRYQSSKLKEPLQYAVSGGKRIRPLMLLHCIEATGGSWEDGINAAVAIELLHTESIIHDDIIDEDNSRRNKPSFYIKYGYNVSLLTADFVFGIILDIVSREDNPKVAKMISSAALQMCEGEFHELNNNLINNMSWEEYIRLIRLKTASLFESSSRLGAIIGKGDHQEELAQYGLSLGLAYQIQDDALDWDINENTEKGLNIGKEKDLLEYLTEQCEFYANQAKRSLDNIDDSESKQYLVNLTDLVIESAARKSKK